MSSVRKERALTIAEKISLQTNDCGIRAWRYRSTLAQVVACCLTAPSHCLNQCWLIAKSDLWHAPESNFRSDTHDDLMTSSNGNIFLVTDPLCGEFTGHCMVNGEFPSQKPVTRSFDIFFDLRLNKRSNELSWRRRFDTSSCSLWRHCSDMCRVKRLKDTAISPRVNELNQNLFCLSNHRRGKRKTARRRYVLETHSEFMRGNSSTL